MDQNRFTSLGAIIAMLIMVVCLVLGLQGTVPMWIAGLIGFTALTRLV